MVEVTVTNHIDRERLLRIQKKKIPTIEIDLSTFGGVLTIEHFERILLNELLLQRLVIASNGKPIPGELHREVSTKADRARERQNELMAEIEAKAAILQKPLEVLASGFFRGGGSLSQIFVLKTKKLKIYLQVVHQEKLLKLTLSAQAGVL